MSRRGTLSAISEPEYECALFRQRCLNEGIIVVALKSNMEIGSPKYLILSGDVLVSDVILSAKSVETFLPIPVPKPFNKPASLKPLAESTVVPMANPPATPPATISSLTMFFFLIMGLICYLIQLELRMSYFVLFNMGDHLLLYIVF